jgi:hypothetical protein
MTKNDPHKYKGKNKTTSNKAARVGPKPWSKAKKNAEGRSAG